MAILISQVKLQELLRKAVDEGVLIGIRDEQGIYEEGDEARAVDSLMKKALQEEPPCSG